MQVPPAMYIESAVDTLLQKQADPKQKFWLDDEVKELSSANGLDRLGVKTTVLSDDFKKGYLLALEVARTIIATSDELIGKEVNKDNIL